MPQDGLISVNDIPCCPEISKDPCCDRIQFSYRLENRLRDVAVEVVIVAELERCPGPMALGDVVYSTTLLPGEKVRLATSSRNTRFTYDAESEVSYRHEQSSEESYYMSSMDRFMSDLTVRDRSQGEQESETDFETKASGAYGSIGFAGGGTAKVSGNFSSESSFDFLREISRHAEASHERSVQATRSANAIQFGEVQSRTHAEGESESAYEAATRVFENRNQCHAVTYFAYQLVKRQTIRFRIKAVLRRVIDPAGNAVADARPLRPATGVAVLPDGVLATANRRLEVETAGRTSAVAASANLVSGLGTQTTLTAVRAQPFFATAVAAPTFAALKPLTPAQREEALKAADQELVKAGVIDKVGGVVSPRLQAELSFERTVCLPTQAIMVKGCLDKCSVCEDARKREIELDLERKALENKLLARRIEILEKSQEYRCCPVGEAEEEDA
jgi:hypothetical protein